MRKERNMDNVAVLEPTFINLDDKRQKKDKKTVDQKKLNKIIDSIKDSLPDSDHDGSHLQ